MIMVFACEMSAYIGRERLERRTGTGQMGFWMARIFVKLVTQYQYIAPVIRLTWRVSRILQ